MEHKVFQNKNLMAVLIIGTPEGGCVTVHPGQYLKGNYFEHLVEEISGFIELTEDEAKKLSDKDFEYIQKR
jgi:hypothetical protein